MPTMVPHLALPLVSDAIVAKDGCTLSMMIALQLKRTLAREHMIECGVYVQNMFRVCPSKNPIGIICSTWEEKDNYNVVVDVEECSGCCDGPRQWSTTFIGRSGLDMDMPGLMDTDYHSYRLQLDGWEAWFDRCSGQRIALGDYGDYSDGTLTRTGNIFEDMRTLGIKPMNSVCCPVVSRISSVGWSTRHVKNWEGLVVENDFRKPLVLCDPKGLSLPANDDFVLLLKALSTRAAGKRLVISVIQCSDFYRVDDEERIDDGQRRRSGDDSGNHSAVSRVLTPLYAVARPQVWKREPPCWHRKQRFETIR
ncbi:hypothetical protein BKA82DRAFT_768248 [Pisolithus tinctorius]|uniref:Uncharacterized protein n=1 Tax=Pisolithus tinctorius Marx 270 TaxID=870435 RepID=A0A0C3JS22_PISTI|nr:hypothetical protein BKA82DRAFT_768248 [Pisolithus tinctorius]KIO00282.1 hypothetical protein M404DRAFT_768248 [Pisolithus tinctorius Marx 270]